ncbi:MAG: hypothetical protein ACK55Z_27935, partial [bacterium]
RWRITREHGSELPSKALKAAGNGSPGSRLSSRTGELASPTPTGGTAMTLIPMPFPSSGPTMPTPGNTVGMTQPSTAGIGANR